MREPAARLRPLALGDEAEAQKAHAELLPDHFDFLLEWDPGKPWSEYLQALRRLRVGQDLPADRVPATFLVAQAGDDLVGRASIRHELNDWLARYGGHIGYAVRPAFRRRGYATEILRQSLVIARAEGVDRVLVTCDDDNLGSAAVIERCDGVLEDVVASEDGVR